MPTMRTADAALLVGTLIVAWSFYRAHKNASFDFSFFDLIMENGKVSRLACIAMGAFAVMCWIMVRLTLDGKMTEGYMGLFGGLCFTPIVAKLFSMPQSTLSTSTTSTSTTSTSEQT